MKFTIIVLDSVGVGALPDAASFGAPPGDGGSHTLNHTLEHTGVQLPNLARLGLGQIPTVRGVPAVQSVQGAFGRMLEVSPGKDTSTGHWEFMGVQLQQPFQTFPEGFPPAVMDRFTAATGAGFLCNRPYSGTEVIRDFGPEHLKTGDPVVYTSADSVFQIAAHLDVVPIERLYAWCQAAREILQGEFAVARVIARPFRGSAPAFERAGELRRDYSLAPPPTVLDALRAAGKDVIGVGKIPDIYDHRGFCEEIHTDDNPDGLRKTIARMKQHFDGLLFCNLVDFDAKYGHRRDVAGYGAALVAFDAALPDILAQVPQGDAEGGGAEGGGALLIISDHGNDPTWPGSDHTREYGLLLGWRPGVGSRGSMGSVDLGERATFADVGATVAEALGATWTGPGTSFWQDMQS